MATAYDADGSTPGKGGNGWARVVEEMGTVVDGSKKLKGSMDVYQIIDFTNMKADTLTITSSGGAITYSNLGTCDVATNAKSCDAKAVKVESMTVASGTWTGYYAFPQTHNVGTWKNAGTSSVTTTVETTKKVSITGVKPGTAFLKYHGYASDAKAVLLRYRFDITGMTASDSTGVFMNYDPVVTSKPPVTTSNPPAAAGAAEDASSAWGIVPGGLLALTMALVLA